MKIILLFIFLTLEFLQADSNITNEVNATLMEMLAVENKQKNEESISIIENALKKKKAEEERKAKE